MAAGEARKAAFELLQTHERAFVRSVFLAMGDLTLFPQYPTDKKVERGVGKMLNELGR